MGLCRADSCLVRLWHDNDSCRRRVDAALRLCLRHPLNTVDAVLEFQAAVHAEACVGQKHRPHGAGSDLLTRLVRGWRATHDW